MTTGLGVKKPARKVLQYKLANYNDIKEELTSYLPQFIEGTSSKSVNNTWTIFEHKLQDLINKYIPTNVISGNKTHKPLITKSAKSLHRKRNKIYAKQKA